MSSKQCTKITTVSGNFSFSLALPYSRSSFYLFNFEMENYECWMEFSWNKITKKNIKISKKKITKIFFSSKLNWLLSGRIKWIHNFVENFNWRPLLHTNLSLADNWISQQKQIILKNGKTIFMRKSIAQFIHEINDIEIVLSTNKNGNVINVDFGINLDHTMFGES